MRGRLATRGEAWVKSVATKGWDKAGESLSGCSGQGAQRSLGRVEGAAQPERHLLVDGSTVR